MSRCRACGREIRWIKTARGSWMPCELEAVPYTAEAGGPEKLLTAAGEIVSGRAVQRDGTGGAAEVSGVGFRPHWATCRGADEYRRVRE